MIIKPEQSAWISERIAAFLQDPSEPEYLRIHAERSGTLPLLVDWTGFWGIDTSGDIWLVDHEYGVDPVLEGDERVCRTALYRGALKYPELGALVPVRPAESVDCPHCLGTGRIAVPGLAPDTIICYCGGLGWVV